MRKKVPITVKPSVSQTRGPRLTLANGKDHTPVIQGCSGGFGDRPRPARASSYSDGFTICSGSGEGRADGAGRASASAYGSSSASTGRRDSAGGSGGGASRRTS